ncbi:DUF2125 domain-containing protein [Brytella acorum]|uniref:DUF2125 domain-containing protein n=1 Tax=Brytella acorum TaxID=2959299 RepID=A0AA35UIY8_9PROT|nr:DUF2125 domain-containing protein [Brytella acorum]MDF3624262.1 DUF2125 domain-containing protein [Brytella acorum]CAI9121164.1 DUF2125 domain-containing protein [Brytella acorum]
MTLRPTRKTYLLLGALFLGAIAVGATFWGAMSYVLDRRLDSLRQNLARNGVSFSFSARHPSGGIGRVSVVFSDPRLSVPKSGLAMGGPSLVVDFSIFHPHGIILHLNGTYRLIVMDRDDATRVFLAATTQDGYVVVPETSAQIPTRTMAFSAPFVTIDATAPQPIHVTASRIHARVTVTPRAPADATRLAVDLSSEAAIVTWPGDSAWKAFAPGWPPQNVHLAIAALSSGKADWDEPHGYERLLVQDVAGRLGALTVRGAGSVTLPDRSGSITLHFEGLRQTARAYTELPTVRQALTQAAALHDVLDDGLSHLDRIPDQTDAAIQIRDGIPQWPVDLLRKIVSQGSEQKLN